MPVTPGELFVLVAINRSHQLDPGRAASYLAQSGQALKDFGLATSGLLESLKNETERTRQRGFDPRRN